MTGRRLGSTWRRPTRSTGTWSEAREGEAASSFAGWGFASASATSVWPRVEGFGRSSTTSAIYRGGTELPTDAFTPQPSEILELRYFGPRRRGPHARGGRPLPEHGVPVAHRRPRPPSGRVAPAAVESAVGSPTWTSIAAALASRPPAGVDEGVSQRAAVALVLREAERGWSCCSSGGPRTRAIPGRDTRRSREDGRNRRTRIASPRRFGRPARS